MKRSALLIIAASIGIAALATTLQGPVLWSVDAVRAFQGTGALRLPMELVTTLGAEGFILPLVMLLYWCIDKPLGSDLALLLTISATSNITLKALLQRPRPFWSDSGLRLISSGASFSTPSGHAANSTALLGYLAWRVAGPRAAEQPAGQPSGAHPRWPAAMALLLGIFLVCLSRVYLGVHFPGDVIWGCAAGIVVLTLYIGLKPLAAAWLSNRSLGEHLALAAGAAAAVLALNLGFLAAGATCGPPFAAFCSTARIQALGESTTAAGLVFGAWSGLALEQRYVRFVTDGAAGRRILRGLLGLAGLLVLALGVELLLRGAAPTLTAALGVLRAATAGIWALFAWPWMFVRLGLAERQT